MGNLFDKRNKLKYGKLSNFLGSGFLFKKVKICFSLCDVNMNQFLEQTPQY